MNTCIQANIAAKMNADIQDTCRVAHIQA